MSEVPLYFTGVPARPETALTPHMFDAVYVYVVPWSEFPIPSYPQHPQHGLSGTGGYWTTPVMHQPSTSCFRRWYSFFFFIALEPRVE